jgi:hypothetical protein
MGWQDCRLACRLYMKTIILILFAVSVVGCATLGPTPVSTGISAFPAERPGVDVQAGAMPGYFLSAATTEDPEGAGISQISALIDPGATLGLPGLVLGARLVGPAHDNQLEPMIGYRTTVGAGRRVAIAGTVHGAIGSGEDNGASYEMSRGGGELGVDVRLGKENRWLEPHLIAAVSVNAISAEGEYCVGDDGRFGIDCPEPPDPQMRTTAEVSGLFPAISGGVAAGFGEHGDGIFHGGRVLLTAAAGTMPHVVAGEQTDAEVFVAVGLALSLSVGASR